jgi:hypothetical protein
VDRTASRGACRVEEKWTFQSLILQVFDFKGFIKLLGAGVTLARRLFQRMAKCLSKRAFIKVSPG